MGDTECLFEQWCSCGIQLEKMSDRAKAGGTLHAPRINDLKSGAADLRFYDVKYFKIHHQPGEDWNLSDFLVLRDVMGGDG